MQEIEKSDITYGFHATLAALESGIVNKLYLQSDLRGKNVERIKEIAGKKKASISWLSKTELSKMTDNGVHQGFVARTSEFSYAEFELELARLQNKENVTLLILDELTDPHNLGSIARTADATALDGIIIPKHRAVGITPIAVKASTGALQRVPVIRVTNLSQTLDKLKKAGFWIFGTDMEGTDYRKWNTSGKIALIIGSEGKGISAGIKSKVDEMITIPIQGEVQSLNASVAAAILMYEIVRNRVLEN